MLTTPPQLTCSLYVSNASMMLLEVSNLLDTSAVPSFVVSWGKFQAVCCAMEGDRGSYVRRADERRKKTSGRYRVNIDAYYPSYQHCKRHPVPATIL